MTYTYNEEKVRNTLASLDWETLVQDLYSSSDINEPVMAYIAWDGRLLFAETLADLDGLSVVTTRHQEIEDSDGPEDWYDISAWVSEVSPEVHQMIESFLTAAATRLYVEAGGDVEGWGKDGDTF